MPDGGMLHWLDVQAYRLVVEVWSLYWPVLLMVLALTAVERYFALEKRQPWRGWWFNMGWHALVLAMGVMLGWTAWGRFVEWMHMLIPIGALRLAPPQGALDHALRLALALLAYDFLIYWAHRLQHAVPFFWAMHRFHHEECHLNAAASLRSHWVNLFYLQIAVATPVTWILGFDAISLPIYLIIHGFVAVSHLNIRLEFGRMSALLVGPQYHRLHHARAKELFDKNFATMLPLWDILFRTYRAPLPGEFGPTGIEGVPMAERWLEALLQPLADWWEMARTSLTRARV